MQPVAIIIARAAFRVVRALNEPLDDVGADGDLARRADLHLVTQTDPDQRVVHGDQALRQRGADVVGVLERGRAGATFLPVDDDEVRPRALVEHRLAEGEHVRPAADAQLDPHRFAARQLAQLREEPHQLARRAERGVRGRADAVATLRHPAGGGDLRGHLSCGQHTPDPRLRALGELDLEGLHFLRELSRLLGRERSIGIANAVLRGADLCDHVAPAFEVKWRSSALARVHPAAGERRANEGKRRQRSPVPK
jgi:hypothetical protein